MPNAQYLDALQEQLLSREYELNQIVRVAEEAGFSVLGFGGHRLALALEQENVVAKLAFQAQGLADNHLEWLFWEAANPPLQALLAPTLARTPAGINFQGRCLPVAIESITSSSGLTRALAQAGIADGVVNLGLYEGRVVCFDYALLRPEVAMRLLGAGQKSPDLFTDIKS